MPSVSIPVAAATIGAAGSVAGGIMGGNAAKSAAATQAAAADRATQAQLDMFNKTEANLRPFVDVGKSAIPMVQNLLGLGGQGTEGIGAALESTPGYQFVRDQGLRAVNNAAAAGGLAQSGSAIKGAETYATGLASMTYQQQLQNYLNLQATGQNAAAQVGSFGQQAVTQANDYAMSGAAATAAGQVGAANAMTTGIQNATSGIGTTALLLGMQNQGMYGNKSGGYQNPALGNTIIANNPLLF